MSVFLFALTLLAAVPGGSITVKTRLAPAPAGQGAWSAFLPTPAALPLLTTLGLPSLTPAQTDSLAVVLSASGLDLNAVRALPAPPAQAGLVREKVEAYAAALAAPDAPEAAGAVLAAPGPEGRERAALLAALAPRHAAALETARLRAETRVEEVRRAWEMKEGGMLVAGAPGRSAPLLAPAAPGVKGDAVLGAYQPPPAPPSEPRALPFEPRRAIPLARSAAVMERRLAAGEAVAEDAYRTMDPDAFFAGNETRRMDTLLSRQAADPAQAMQEVISNAQDASNPGGKKVGRFGVGGLQVLGELKDPADRVVMETSRGDGQAAQFVFWKKDGEVFFDYRMAASTRRGTRFRVIKPLGETEARRRREFLERKLRANDRGPVVWKSGGRLNHPETYAEWGAPRPAAAAVPPVNVSLDASGYEIADAGKGMGLKEVFERYLKPYGTDKPVSATSDPARLLHRDAGGDGPRASLAVSMVEIEAVPLSARGRRLNLADDLFVDLPHDTDLSEERGTVSLVPADQKVGGAVRGLRLLIDRLTDPSIADPARFALINGVAALIREKQPAAEKGVTRGDLDTATDLLWYLRERLERSGLLDAARKDKTAFLPNAPKWSPLEGISDRIVFLDEALFAPEAGDYERAGFQPLPPALAEHPAWKALRARSPAAFYSRALRSDGPLAIVADDVVVIDASLLTGSSDPDVLAARVARELSASPRAAAAPARAGVLKRLARPLVLIAALVAVPALYTVSPALEFYQQNVSWSEYASSRFETPGNRDIQSAEEIAAARNGEPQTPFGVFTPPGQAGAFFVHSVRTRLSELGHWSFNEGAWSQDAPARTDPAQSVEVRYRLGTRGADPQRLLNQFGGRISGVQVTDTWGRAVAHRFDARTDTLILDEHKTSVLVRYRIERSPGLIGLEDAQQPLPANELGDFPRQWRKALDPLKNATDAEKQAGIERLLARDFIYDYAQLYERDGNSWSSTAQNYLDAGKPIPIICNTSGLYYYMMARYLGLPAAYVSLVNSEKGVFYHDLTGHAQVLVKVGGEWKLIETTSFMPLKNAAPRLQPGARYGAEGTGRGGYGFSSSSSGPVAKALVGAALTAAVGFLVWAFCMTARNLYRTRRSVTPLRRSVARFGRLRERLLPFWWNKWGSLAADADTDMRAMATPWGLLYRNFQSNGAAFYADEAGRFTPVPSGEPQVAGKELLFINRSMRPWRNDAIVAFDGARKRTLYWRFFELARPTLVQPLGRERYARTSRGLIRLDVEAGTHQELVRLPLNSTVEPLDSRGGVDRFVSARRLKKGRFELRVLSVSGGRARWEETRALADVAGGWPGWVARPAGDQVVFEVNPLKGGRFLAVTGRDAPVPLTGRVQAVLAGKVFVVDDAGSKSYDLAAGRWEAASLGGVPVLDARPVGDDLFFVQPLESGASGFFCDADGTRLADTPGNPSKAVRSGGVIYYRGSGENVRALHAASAEPGPERHFRLHASPERLFSRAAARATGLDAAVFTPFDSEWDAVPAPLQSAQTVEAVLAAAARDEASLARLDAKTRAALPHRAAMMPDWSLARLFLGPEAARAPELSPLTERLDRLARENLAEPDRLRALLEPVDRLLRLSLEDPARAAGHYLDLIEAAPQILDGLRRALLEPLLASDGSRFEPLAYLGAAEAARRTLPAETQLYLQLLQDGVESLLRREKDDAPAGTPSAVLDGRGESIGRLIAAARALTDEQLDAGGVAAFARAFERPAPGARADISSVAGVVTNQGLSAPVWIRELVQNARDAVREARRLGRPVPAEIALRSHLSEDGARWIVSVRDGVGMKLSRLLKAMLTPEATTKTLADEVRGFLALEGTPAEKAERLLDEFFDDAAKSDEALRAFLREAAAAAPAQAAKTIAERLSERMRKGGAGFFGIGFFTVFGGADAVLVRSGAGGVVREVALTPVRDAGGRLTDIRLGTVREWQDPSGARTGTEVLRVKNVTPENAGRILVENAYVHIMAGKYAGAVSDIAVALNGRSVSDGLETVGERAGLRSRLGAASRPRWTVDELFVQEPPQEGLALIPSEVRSALGAAGWNLDFPAATPVVRTRTSVLGPQRHAAAAAALALPASYRLYRAGALRLPGLPSYAQYRKLSPWDSAPLDESLLRDAAALAARTETPELWARYAAQPRQWARLTLAALDDKETVLRGILGPRLSSALDAARADGKPLRVGPLPREGSEGYEEAVRTLHSDALARLAGKIPDEFAAEPAVAGLGRVLGLLASFMDTPPSFVVAGTALWEALRRCLDEGKAVPLMEALLAACGRDSDADAVRLFEGWLKGQGAASQLAALYLDKTPRPQAESSLDRLWKAASRGRPLPLPLIAPPRRV